MIFYLKEIFSGKNVQMAGQLGPPPSNCSPAVGRKARNTEETKNSEREDGVAEKGEKLKQDSEKLSCNLER